MDGELAPNHVLKQINCSVWRLNDVLFVLFSCVNSVLTARLDHHRKFKTGLCTIKWLIDG